MLLILGATQTEIYSINNQDDLIGRYILPDQGGQLGAVGHFEAVPTPEPGTAILVTAGVLTAGFARRRKLRQR